MADLESQQPTTEEDADSIEKFAQEYHDATYQRRTSEEPEEAVEEATPEEPVEEPVVEDAPAEEPEPQEEPAAEEPSEEEPAEETPPVEEDPQVTRYAVPDHESFGELRGKRATAAELEKAGLLDKMFTRAHQEMHHTKLYQELKKKFDQDLEEKLRAAGVNTDPKKPEAAPVDPKAWAEDIERNFVPQLRKLAEAGSFEPDFVEAYPKVASHMAHQFESMRLVGAGVIEALNELKTDYEGQRSVTTAEQNFNHLKSSMNELATSDPMYQSLTDDSEKALFVEWMRAPENSQPWKKMDIVDELSKPENLAGAYAAFRTATRHLRTAPAATPAPSEVRAKAALASAGGGNSRPASQPQELNEFDQLKQELEVAQRSAFGR